MATSNRSNNQDSAEKQGTTPPDTGTDANAGTNADASGMSAKQRYLLRLQGPKSRVSSTTHIGFPVGKKAARRLVEVPIDGELEVSAAEYEAIMETPLGEGYSWGHAMAEGTTTTPAGSTTSPVTPNATSAGQ